MAEIRKMYKLLQYYWMRFFEPVFAVFIIGVGAVLAVRVAIFYIIFSFAGFYAFFSALDKRKKIKKPS